MLFENYLSHSVEEVRSSGYACLCLDLIGGSVDIIEVLALYLPLTGFEINVSVGFKGNALVYE